MVVIGSGNECAIRLALCILTVYHGYLLGWHAPVAVFVAGHDTVFPILVFQVLQPAFHSGIVALQGLLVAILVQHHFQTEGQCCGPCHIVAIIVPVGRCHIGYATVFALCFGDVACPFGIEHVVVKHVCLAKASFGAVAQPWLAFVALRTIHRHTLVVVQNTPYGIFVYPVQCLVR